MPLDYVITCINNSRNRLALTENPTERDWQAALFVELQRSTPKDSGLIPILEYRAVNTASDTKYNGRADLVLIDQNATPIIAIELKIANTEKSLTQGIDRDYEKLKNLSFKSADEQHVNPLLIAAGALRNNHRTVIAKIKLNQAEKIFTLMSGLDPSLQVTYQNTVDAADEHISEAIKTSLIEPARAIYHDVRHRTTLYQFNEATWQILMGENLTHTHGTALPHYESKKIIGDKNCRADTVVNLKDAGKIVLELKIHNETAGGKNSRHYLTDEDLQLYCQGIRKTYETEPRRENGKPILTGLHHLEKKIRSVRSDRLRCINLINKKEIDGAYVLFCDNAELYNNDLKRLGLDEPAFKGLSATEIYEQSDKFRDKVAELCKAYQSRCAFITKTIHLDVTEPKVHFQYFALLRLPHPFSGAPLDLLSIDKPKIEQKIVSSQPSAILKNSNPINQLNREDYIMPFLHNSDQWPKCIKENVPIAALNFLNNSFKKAWPNCDSFITNKKKEYWAFGKQQNSRIAAFVFSITKDFVVIAFTHKNEILQPGETDFLPIIKRAIPDSFDFKEESISRLTKNEKESNWNIIKVAYPISHQNKICTIPNLLETLTNLKDRVIYNKIFQ